MGHNTSQRICARLQIHHHCKVEQLTEPQITALSAYLSSTSTAAAAIETPLAAPPLPPKCMRYEPPSLPASPKSADPLDTLKIETDLKKQVSADIAHLKAIGTYRGRRYVDPVHDLWMLADDRLTAGLPSRGQRTKTNARTARKLNDKRRYTTYVSTTFCSSRFQKADQQYGLSISKRFVVYTILFISTFRVIQRLGSITSTPTLRHALYND